MFMMTTSYIPAHIASVINLSLGPYYAVFKRNQHGVLIASLALDCVKGQSELSVTPRKSDLLCKQFLQLWAMVSKLC